MAAMIIHINNSMQHKTFLSRFKNPITLRSRFFSTRRHMYSYGTYLTVPLYIRILKCSMHLAKHVIPKSQSVLGITIPKVSYRGMAAYTYNEPEKNPTALGLKNNKIITKGSGKNAYSFRHKEFHRKTCGDPYCKKKVCAKPCGPQIDVKAVGNSSHKAPKKSGGTAIILDSKKDINGNNKPQEAFMYDKAHSTSMTKEIPHGTTFINQPHVIAEIVKHEDNS